MIGAAYAMALAAAGGVLLGTVLPGAESLSRFALPALFVQTLVAVGALAEANKAPNQARAASLMLTVHLWALTAPLLLIGLWIGLDTPLGLGTFVLGAVPPAASLPGFAAACGVRVRLVVRYCVIAYFASLFVTPMLLLGFIGDAGNIGAIAITLLVGLLLPATLGGLFRQWLVRLPRKFSLTLVAISVLVLSVGLGPHLRSALSVAADDRETLLIALLLATGRLAVGVIAGLVSWRSGLGVEVLMAAGYKNSVLAAVIAFGVAGEVAALPGLLSLFSEAALLGVASRMSVVQRRKRSSGAMGPRNVRSSE